MGALPPHYSFALNPYAVHLTMCPDCRTKTRVRKLPLAIHVEGLGRLCLACDMVIVHQQELELLIAARLREVEGPGRALDYLVLGTVASDVWRRGLTGGVSFDELVRNMADFRKHMQIEQIGRGWAPAK